MRKNGKYPQSVSLSGLFPGIDDMPGYSDQRLHHALKRYRNDVAAGKPNGGFAIYLEKNGIYSREEIDNLRMTFPDSFTSGFNVVNPRKRNGHSGGIYPKDGK